MDALEAKNYFLEEMRKVSPLSENTGRVLKQHIKYNFYPKNEFVTPLSFVHKYVHFVINGSIKLATYLPNRNERIIHIAEKNLWVTEYLSHYNQESGECFVQTLEDSDIISFSYNTFENLAETHPEIGLFLYRALKKYMILFQKRTIALNTLNAEDKYKSFLKTFPVAAKNVTDKTIASFIGVSPQFVSRKKIER